MKKEDKRTDEELVLLAQDGDKQATEALLSKYSGLSGDARADSFCSAEKPRI